MPDTIAAEILRQAEATGPNRSICPSDVARALFPGTWRQHLTEVRRAAVALLRQNRIEILRKGTPVPPEQVRGVIRLRIAPPAEPT